MPATVAANNARRAAANRPAPTNGMPPRRPFRDNPRLILAGIAVLLAVLGALLAVTSGTTSQFSPDFLTEFVLYALSATNLMMLVALVFVLARNIVKLVVERRRALPFARFRAKLVAVLLGMTLIPAVLVLLVGSELIRNSVDRWFNAPVEEVLTSAESIAGDYYHDRQVRVTDDATRIARALGALRIDGNDVSAVRELVNAEVVQGRVRMIEVYQIVPGGGAAAVAPYVTAAAADLPHGYARAVADRIAQRAAS